MVGVMRYTNMSYTDILNMSYPEYTAILGAVEIVEKKEVQAIKRARSG
jgi:hypothetical protein